jgi:hypothetical protein
MEDYKGTGQFIDDSVNELLDIWFRSGHMNVKWRRDNFTCS